MYIGLRNKNMNYTTVSKALKLYGEFKLVEFWYTWNGLVNHFYVKESVTSIDA